MELLCGVVEPGETRAHRRLLFRIVCHHEIDEFADARFARRMRVGVRPAREPRKVRSQRCDADDAQDPPAL